MAAIGILLIGFGGLTAWAGLDKTIVFDVLRSMLGVTVPNRSAEGAAGNVTTTTVQSSAGAPAHGTFSGVQNGEA